MGQPKTRVHGADLNSHTIVVYYFIILAVPTISCKQTQLIDDIMHTNTNFVLCSM